MTARNTNRLAQETSPYLLQHANNPVAWQPWDNTALEEARREDKPILLSIGYSACHWCHVMEHESFEDEQVAEYMNKHFVCIKVDREERPDLDKIYQTAHHLLTQRAGGWPLNVVLAPDTHAPFFAGTYFPNEPRHGLPSFLQVMQQVQAHFQKHRDDMPQHASAFKDAFARMESAAGQTALTHDLVEQAIDELIRYYDPVNGGFGSAPKFPHPSNLALCLSYSTDPDAQQAQRSLHIAQHSLTAMGKGGLFDHLGGGFYRYSVDNQWTIPHFEKMLYDNAQLISLYTDLAMLRDSHSGQYRQWAEQTGNWAIREMQSEAGGYYSTLDADSEGEEGKFYVWSSEELKSLLTETQWTVLEASFGLRGTANFEGKWHLNRVETSAAVTAERCGLPVDKVEALIVQACQTLFVEREKRIRPGRDEKIITSWNGLMICAMAHCGRFLNIPEFVDSANRAVDFIQQKMWRDGRLFAISKDGRCRLNGYLDDYVFVLSGVLELLQCRWSEQHISFAIALADAVLEHFEDADLGGLFFTSDDHETLLHRSKPAGDESIPSGNGVGALVLLRLGHVLANKRYLDAAEKILNALSGSIAGYPSGHCALLMALEEYLHPTETIILRGNFSELSRWQSAVTRQYNPHRVVLPIPDDATGLPGILAERRNQAEVTAYVCQGFACQPPVTDLETLERSLN